MTRKNAIRLGSVIVALSLAMPVTARVKSVNIEDDGPLGSVPTIEIVQTRDPDGNLRYSHFAVDDFIGDPTVNLKAKIAAQCKWGYLLSAVELVTPPTAACSDDFGPFFDTCNTYYGATALDSDEHTVKNVGFTNGNRTLGSRIEDFHVPLYEFSDLIDQGNQRVAERAANIFEEENIRTDDWIEWVPVDVGFNVRCKHAVGYTGAHKWWKGDAVEQQVRVIYRGASSGSRQDSLQTRISPRRAHELPGGAKLFDRVHVDANLIALTSTEPGECRLDLSGTFTTNAATTIHYRLVDDKGVMSPLFEVPVNQTHTAFVHHPIDLSEREPEDLGEGREFGFSTIDSTRGLGSFTANPTNRLQGFYQIEVILPHQTESNIADFNIEPCYSGPQMVEAYDRGAGEFRY